MAILPLPNGQMRGLPSLGDPWGFSGNGPQSSPFFGMGQQVAPSPVVDPRTIGVWEGEGGRAAPDLPSMLRGFPPSRGVGPPPGYVPGIPPRSMAPFQPNPVPSLQAGRGLAVPGQPGGEVIPFDPRSTLPKFGPIIEGTLAGQQGLRGVLPNPYAAGVATAMYPTPAAAQTLQPGQPGDPHAPARDAFSGVQPQPSPLPEVFGAPQPLPDPLGIGRFFHAQAEDMAARARVPMQSYADRASPEPTFNFSPQFSPANLPPAAAAAAPSPQGLPSMPSLPGFFTPPPGPGVVSNAAGAVGDFYNKTVVPYLNSGPYGSFTGPTPVASTAPVVAAVPAAGGARGGTVAPRGYSPPVPSGAAPVAPGAAPMALAAAPGAAPVARGEPNTLQEALARWQGGNPSLHATALLSQIYGHPATTIERALQSRLDYTNAKYGSMILSAHKNLTGEALVKQLDAIRAQQSIETGLLMSSDLAKTSIGLGLVNSMFGGNAPSGIVPQKQEPD